MTNRRTKREIVTDLAQRLKKPFSFHTAGDQTTYGQSCIAYPDGTVKEYNTMACTYFQRKLKSASDDIDITFEIYMEEQARLFDKECKRVSAIKYIKREIENYI